MTEVTRAQAETAKRVAAEVRRASDAGLIAKATTLLHAFRDEGGVVDPEAIIKQLEVEERLTIAPPSLKPPESVRISRGTEKGEVPRSHVRRIVLAGQAVDSSSEHVAEGIGGVVWLDIDPPNKGADAHYAEEVLAEIENEIGPNRVRLDMVEGLLKEDTQPKLETFGVETGHVRGVSVVAAIAREQDSERTGGDRGAELFLQPVEMLVGRNWILSCWHNASVLGGEDAAEEGRLLQEPFLSHVGRRLSVARETIPGAGEPTAGDLGVVLARTLIDTYEATYRMMERWLSDWEVDFSRLIKSAESPDLKLQQIQISTYLHMASEVHRRVKAFEHATHSSIDSTWFSGMTPLTTKPAPKNDRSQFEELTGGVQAALKNFGTVKVDVRTNMEQLVLQGSKALQETSAKLQESSSDVEKSLALITGLVLVPSLVVGIFGANTRLPGGGTWIGFELMLALMAVSGFVVFLFIKKSHPGGTRRFASDDSNRRVRRKVQAHFSRLDPRRRFWAAKNS